MQAGGVGFGKKEEALKNIPSTSDKVVILGGENYRIGMGGAAVSSADTGEFESKIELNAIQRSNPEMQKRAMNAIRGMIETDNPIVSIHDHGAGGHLNCLSELVEDTGGEIDLDIATDGQRNTLVKLDPLSIDPHFGIKAGFRQLFEVRGGLSNIQQFSNLDDSKYWGVQPNLGLGVAFKGFSLDYAFTRLGASEANYYTHIFSIKLRLDQPKNGQK